MSAPLQTLEFITASVWTNSILIIWLFLESELLQSETCQVCPEGGAGIKSKLWHTVETILELRKFWLLIDKES